jgi:hypothetical protein
LGVSAAAKVNTLELILARGMSEAKLREVSAYGAQYEAVA